MYICVSLSELIFIIYAWEADSACEPSLAYLVLDAAETFVIGSRTKRGIKKVMNTNIKSICNCVIVKRVEKVNKVRGFNQSAWKHFLPVLLILLLTGMSWSTTAAQTSAYVTNFFSDTVSVINTTNNTLTTAVSVGSHPIAAATTSNGNRVYVANQNSASVSVINTATNTVIATIPVGIGPSGVAITDGGRVYVTNQGSDTVSVINTTTNVVTAVVSTNGVCPFGIAIPPDSLVPTAAPVTISGRVMLGLRKGLFRAMLNLTDADGNTRTTFTNPFGYYQFQEVEVGKTYILTVSSETYQFMPQVLTINEEIENLNFTIRQ